MTSRRARFGWLLVLGSALAAAAAFGDTLRTGERLPGEIAAAAALPAFSVTLPGTASALAASPDGRVAAVVRQELVLLGADGTIRLRRPLPGPAKAVVFGAAESAAAELVTGSAVLRYRDLFTRAWDASEGKRGSSVAPAALPTGGFVFARGPEVVVTDGEAHEVRRLHLPDAYEVTQLQVLPEGIHALATSDGGASTALVHLGWGERVTIRAVVRGKAVDQRLGRSGVELALDGGGLVHVSLAGTIARVDLPDDGYALTAFEQDRSVGIAKGQLVLFRREGGRIRTSTPFGAPVSRTDAGLLVPRVLVSCAGPTEPFWVLTADGTLWRNAATDLDVISMQNTRCDASAPAFLVTSPGRALVGCQNRLVALGGPAPVATVDAGTGFRW